MAEFFLDPCVQDELWAIWEFIARDNPDAATRVVEAAFDTFNTLASAPTLGRPRKFRNPRLKGVRARGISGFHNYLVFYRSVAGGVQVLHVYHGARNIEALFDKA
jgi:toxin ParE1/3/4